MDGIEEAYPSELRVLRVDVQSQAGKALGKRYQAYMTPTFIFFDSQGVEQWRTIGTIDREQVQRYLKGAR